MEIEDIFFSHPNKNYNEHIKNIAQSFDEPHHKEVALYHDLGKLSSKFQKYISLKQYSDESQQAFEKRRAKLKTTHTLESAYLYFSNEEDRREAFLANFFAILKHHTSLPDIKEDMNNYLSTIDNYVDERRLEMIENISLKSSIDFEPDIYAFIDFFEELYEEDFYQTIENFFLFKKRYSRLILADKFEAIFSEPYQNIDYLQEEQIDIYIQNMHDIIASKPKNSFRNSAKKAIFDNYQKNKNSNIYLIKAPTGVGKTFIALELALTIAKDTKNKRRIITAIPFTSIIDQTHREYENILGDVLKYHHLTKYKETKEEDEKEQFSQKVFLTDIWHEPFIVTTFNQLLYTLFSNHNRDNVRLETLRDSVIIVDEVQNIPRVLISSVVKVFELFAKAYNIHFIIMSATMPSFDGLLEDAVVLSEDWFYDKKENRYRLHFKENINSFESLAEAINSQDKSVLCVVNTIDKAKTLFEQIEGEEREDKFLLTTHQIPLHRQEIIGEIKEALAQGKKIILIATQLIEAGVDLDFDVGYREFAPFGSIIQMAGRVNREGKKGVCDVFVFDFLATANQNEDVKRLPYRAIDLQEDHTIEWLSEPLEEIAILENLESYFKSIQEETSSIDLLEPMKKLAFFSLFELLNENFMPNQPWKVSLFIEVEANQFGKYIEERNEILNTPDYDTFEAMNRIKNLEKDLGAYTITVNHKLIEKLAQNYPITEKFGRYILIYDNPTYEKYRGFNPEYTAFEEMFDDGF
jgi:CRISPR-associated endonuclease/helicase Cas3